MKKFVLELALIITTFIVIITTFIVLLSWKNSGQEIKAIRLISRALTK